MRCKPPARRANTRSPRRRYGRTGRTDEPAIDWSEWCRSFFVQMRDGMFWGIPRNGLIFQRQGDVLALVERQFPPSGFYLDAVKLKAFQAADLEETRRNFGAVGIMVTGELSEELYAADQTAVDELNAKGLMVKLTEVRPAPRGTTIQ